MCREATKEDKEDLNEKVTELRGEMRDEKVRSNGNQTQAATSTRHPTRFALMTKKDNVKVARKKQKQAIEKLAKLKFRLMQQLKRFKEEQYEIFAGVPETKQIDNVPMISQGESNYMEHDSRQNEKFLAIVKSKQEHIIKRLVELNKLKPEEFDEAATEELLQRIAKVDEDTTDDARNIMDEKNKYNVRNYEYNDHDSVDSFDSDFAETDLGNVDIPANSNGYLPAMRGRNELTIVPEDPVMKESRAPNWRMEPIEKTLQELELKGRTAEEKMFELLEQLGLSLKDLDGTAVFKKQRLVPEETLRFYINSAFRLKYFIMEMEDPDFGSYAKRYWKMYPKDRIMQLYVQFTIQDKCEEMTSPRVLRPYNRMETESLKQKIV